MTGVAVSIGIKGVFSNTHKRGSELLGKNIISANKQTQNVFPL